MAYIAGIVAISNNIKVDKKMTAIGLACTGGAVGVMICPPLTELSIESFGWRGAMLLVGAVNANIVTCGMFMRPIHAPSIHRQANTSDITMDNKRKNGNLFSSITNWSQSFVEPFKVIKKKPVFVAIITARVFSAMCTSSWAIFLVSHAIEKGLSPRSAALLSSIGGIAAIFGRLIPGTIIDSGFVTATQFCVSTQLANTVAYVSDYWSYKFWSLSVAALMNGFIFGSDFVLIFPLCVEILGNEDAIDGYGLCLTPGSTGSIIGGLLIGKCVISRSIMVFNNKQKQSCAGNDTM